MNHYDERDTAEEEANARDIRDEQESEAAAERMREDGFRFIGRHHLRSDMESDASSLESMRAMVFGHLVDLTDNVVKRYRSDLYHDARWLRDYFAEAITFYFAVREAGTSIGDSRKDVSLIGYAALYRVDIVKEERNYGESWYVSIGIEDDDMPRGDSVAGAMALQDGMTGD